MKSHLLLACAVALIALANQADAQNLRHRPPFFPYDGEPHTQRYAYGIYGPGVTWYLAGNAGQLQYLDYLDRLDRAEKFGYPIPADPFESPMPMVRPTVRVGVGIGAGPSYFRRR